MVLGAPVLWKFCWDWQAKPKSRSFTLERDQKLQWDQWGDTLPAGMNNGPMKIMKHVPYSEKNHHFCFFTKKSDFSKSKQLGNPMVSGCPCFNPTLHAFALLRAIHCKVLCASLSLRLIVWLDRVPFSACKTQVVFLPGKNTKGSRLLFFSGKIFWESRWRKTSSN